MHKPASFLCILLALSATALAQNAPPALNVVACTPGVNCAARYAHGRRVLTLKDHDVSISTDLVAQKRFTRASITILNSSPAAIDVVPANFQLTAAQGKQTYAALALPAILKTERHRDSTWGNFFDMGPAATKKETVVTTKTSGVDADTGFVPANGKTDIKVTEITVPDEDARAAARARIDNRKQLLAQDCSKMEASYLRSSTLDPGSTTEGMVYFAPTRTGDELSLSVVVGQYRYVFPLAADAEE